MPFDFEINTTYVFYVALALAVVFAVEALYLVLSNRVSYRRQTNARLAAMEGQENREQVMIELRRQRGLSTEGKYLLPLIRINRLVLQSGTKLGLTKLFLLCASLGAGVFAIAAFVLQKDILLSTGAALATGVAMPFLILSVMRRRRQKKFSAQLPDGLDIIVRSLRAGHPVPVALGMVGREMGDPVGSEFGTTLDEMTYGLDLETALKNMYHRVGQEELGLMVTAVSLQSSTGGNLSEVLSNLSRIIRERFKLRRKVRALTAEGRMSAYGLSALPAFLFGVLSIIAPKYYGEIWGEPITQTVLIATVAWAVVGMGIMYKMVNFKF